MWVLFYINYLYSCINNTTTIGIQHYRITSRCRKTYINGITVRSSKRYARHNPSYTIYRSGAGVYKCDTTILAGGISCCRKAGMRWHCNFTDSVIGTISYINITGFIYRYTIRIVEYRQQRRSSIARKTSCAITGKRTDYTVSTNLADITGYI